MGYDVTFHPVSLEDLQRFVFDVLGDPGLAEERATELITDDAERSILLDLYGSFPSWLDLLRKGQAELATTVAFACAAVAGFRHPYWFARGCAVSFLHDVAPEIEEVFEPLPHLGTGVIAELTQRTPWLPGNHAASGYLPTEHFDRVRQILADLREVEGEFADNALMDVFGNQGLDALERALGYAEKHGLGLVEASEVVIPAQPRAFTRMENMRAHYLKKLEP